MRWLAIMSGEVEVMLDAQQERGNDDAADLLAERDRIIAELGEKDSRTARLVAIEDDTDAGNAAAMVNETTNRGADHE